MSVLLVDDLLVLGTCELVGLAGEGLGAGILRPIGLMVREILVQRRRLVIVMRLCLLIALNTVVVALSVRLGFRNSRLVQKDLLTDHSVRYRLDSSGCGRCLVCAHVTSHSDHERFTELNIVGPQDISHGTVSRPQFANKINFLIV